MGLSLSRLGRALNRTLFHQSTLEPLFESADEDTPRQWTTWPSAEGPRRVVLATSAPIHLSIAAPPRASLTIHCAARGARGARARVVVRRRIAATDLKEHSFVVSAVSADPVWHHDSVPLSARGQRCEVTLAVEPVPAGAERIEIAWGIAALRWPKTAAELQRSVRLAFTEYGLRESWRRLMRHSGALDVDPAAYERWLRQTMDGLGARRTALDGPTPRFACFVHVMDPAALDRTLDTLERQTHPDREIWVWSGTIARAELTPIAGARRDVRILTAADAVNEAAARNLIVERSSADWVVALESGDELEPLALEAFAAAAAGTDVLYSDEDRPGADGEPRLPRFKPGWSPEYLLSRAYVGRLLAVRRSVIAAAGGFSADAASALDHHLLLRLADGAARVRHVPYVLCHCQGPSPDAAPRLLEDERRAIADACRTLRRSVDIVPGARPGLWRVRHQITGAPRVAIVLPTDGRAGASGIPLIVDCIERLIRMTDDVAWDLVVIDNGVLPTAAEKFLAHVPHRRVTYPSSGAFNFSKKINLGVAQADAPFVLLLNDDIEPIHRGWLAAMLEYAQQQAIGAVGAKLFYPDGRVQHVGVVTGVCGIAAHLLHQCPAGTSACADVTATVRNWSAVTGACLLTRRSVYDEVGGFDERLRIDFNDVDFCLRVRAAGYRIAFTPYARLYHHESATFGPRRQQPDDIETMREIWGAALDADPYYNPNFRRDVPDCRPVFERR